MIRMQLAAALILLALLSACSSNQWDNAYSNISPGPSLMPLDD